MATAVVLMTALLSAVAATPAAAAATVLFDNTFVNRTVDGTGTVTKPTAPSGTNVACLTATGNTATGPLLSCSGTSDAQGSGKLRLTAATGSQVGGVFSAAGFPSSGGLDVTFNSYQWGTGGGDGLSFMLAAVDPSNPVPPTAIGPAGGSLGYSTFGGVSGVANAYLGIGLDTYGNFSNSSFQGSACANPTYFGSTVAGAVVVRGPGKGTTGYCGLATTYAGTSASQLTLRAGTRAGSVVPVQVLINPTTSSYTSTTGVVVAAGAYKVVATPVGGTAKTLTGSLPTVAANFYPSSTWVTAAGIPRQLAFGFAGATGSSADAHEVSNVKVTTFNLVSQLAVSTTSYVVAGPAAGAPVNYAVTPSVSAVAAVTAAVSVTQTVPTGVVPVAGYGSGWVCAAAVGQNLTCTTTATSFAAGSTLPVLNVVAIVTGSGVTSALVQSSSPTTASASGATSGTDSTTTAGVVPDAPTGVTVAPAIGSIAGGTSVTIGSSSTTATTAIEIGTAAEQQAGTPVVLLQCPGAVAAGCFTISGSNLVISSMPARAGPAAVTITLVTLGVAGAVAYQYADRPATPAAPTAVAGVRSATVSWVAPAANGSPLTGYIVTRYRNGVAQTPVTYDAAATTRTITGLTANSSYTFKVAAVNALGTSTQSALSAAVTPTSPASAPSITAVTAGTNRATLTWSAPASNGSSPVTGYTVTPYIAGVAQTPQTFTGTGTTQTVTGLTPGTAYTFRVAALGLSGTTVLYRINAGGSAVAANDEGPAWAADSSADNPLRNSTSAAGQNSTATSVDATVPATTPQAIFDSERYDTGVAGDGAEMSWFFPVTSGATVTVRLFFINQFSGTSTVGTRQFDVQLEGSTVLDSFDPVAAAGADLTGTMREFTAVSDGTINIDFLHEALDNPLINGIEIIQTGLPSTGPDSAASTSVTPNASPSLTFAAPPAGQVAVAYSTQLTVSGGTSPLVWSLSSGTVPPGLTLNTSTGLLSGTPTVGGSYAFTVLVTDASSQTASRAVTLVIAAAPVVTFVPAAGEITVAYSQQATVAGGTGPFTWALTAGSLPAGVTLNSTTGLVSGTPTASGTFSVTIAATDARSQTANTTATIVIAALPTLTFAAPPNAQVGLPFSVTLTTAGGSAPLTWSISTGSVPAGLTLNTATGVLSGTPTTVASSSFTVSVVDANNKTASKAATITVAAGPLVIVKTADVTSTVAGGTVSYTITVTNTGSTAFTGVTLSDPLTGVLDDAVYGANLAASSGTAGYASSTVTWTGNVGANSVITITYSVTVANPDLGNKILLNTVTSSTVGTNCAAGSVDARCRSTVNVAGLTIVQIADVATTTPGSVVNFSVQITNTGPTTYSGATFTDNLSGLLDDAVYNTDGTNGGVGSVSYVSPSLSWTGNLAAGASATIRYSVTVANPDNGNRSLTASVTSSSPGSSCPSANPAASCRATVGVVIPSLTVNNSVSTAVPVLRGHWTFDEGSGTAAADTGGSHPATLGAGAGWAEGRQGPSAMSANGSATGNATTAAAVLDTTTSFSVSARVKLNSVSGYQTIVSQDGNAVSGFYLQLRGDTGKFAFARLASDSTQAAPAFPSALAAPVAGQWYQLTGVYNATDSTLSLYVDGQLQQTTATPAGWSATGPLAIGRGKYGGLAVDFVAGVIDDVAVYQGVLTGGGAATTPGTVVPLTTTIINSGQTVYTATSVTLALPAATDDAIYNADATAGSGSVVYNAAAGTLVWSGDLAVGGVVTIRASMTVRNPDPGDKTLTTVASSAAPGSSCPAGSATSICTATVQVRIPTLTITKAANVSTTTPGGVVQYTVTFTNNGQTAYTGATFADSLAGVVDDAGYQNNAVASTGAVSYAGQTLTWTGNLAIGATATITYSVAVNNPDNGDKTLTGTITSTTPGNNCAAGSGDTRCTSSVTVLIPALSITTSVDKSTAIPGEVLRYSISVTNTGQTTYTNVAIAIDFFGVYDDATYNNDSATSTGSLVVAPNGSVSWVLSLAPGATATGSTSFTVNSPVSGDRSMITTVSSEAAGSNCPAAASNPVCRSASTVLIPGLTITKTAGAASVVTGGTVTYSILVANNGQSTYAAATFTDSLASVLDDATYAGGATATSGTVSYSAPTLSWTGSLAPGATATISYTVTIRNPDPGDKRLTNTVVSSSPGNNCAAGSTDNRCTAVVDVLVPGLTLVRAANVATTTPGAVVGYSITVTNTGATAYTGAAFTAALSGVLDDSTYNLDAAATAGTASYAGGNLGWTGNLAIGASATITYSVTVNAADIGNDLLTDILVSSTPGNNCPAGGTDVRCTGSVAVARLIVDQLTNNVTTTPGSMLNLVATYTNTGQVAQTGITISNTGADLLDDVTATGSQTATAGSLTVTPEALTWTGDIPIGGQVTVFTTVTVNDPDLGNKLIRSTFSTTAPGSNCPTNGSDPRCRLLITVLVPMLDISTTTDTTSVAPGGAVHHTIVVSNTGETAYTAATVTDILSGVLDDAVYTGDAAATSGSLSFTAPRLTWTGDVPVGGTVTITFTVTANNPRSGDATMLSRVESTDVGSTCPVANGNSRCRSTVEVLAPGLTIVKTADQSSVALGSTVTFTVAVTNSGQTSYATAQFTDSLAAVLDDATYNPGATTASRGSTSYVDGVLSWTGALTPGQTATITYTVSVANPATGNRSMTNTVVSTTDGSNCAGSSTDPRCTATVAVSNSVAVVLTKSSDVATTVGGDVVSYTVVMANTTTSPIVGASYTDALAGILDDATYNGDATANTGTITFTDTDLSWTGTIAAQSAVTVTYSVTVHTEITGNQLLTGTLTSTTRPGSNNCSIGSSDTRCTNTVGVARLELSQFAAETSATPGSTVHLTQIYINTGTVPYNGISVASPRADTSDDTIPTGDQTATSGSLERTATAITWTGNIPVGGSVTVLRTLTVRNPDPGNQIITATLNSSAPGNNCQTGTVDSRCVFTTAVVTPGLTITKTASTSVTVSGGTVGYTITIANTGQTPYTAATVTDSFVGILDDAGYNANATANTGTVSYSAPTLTWTGDLGVGQTATVTYSVTTNNPGTGDKTMVNTVVSAEVGSSCPAASGDPGCRSIVVVLTPGLTLLKTADVTNATLGSTVSYTVKVTNTGQTSYPTASFTDSLSGVLDDATYNSGSAGATAGTVSYTDGVLSWSGTLAPGAAATITYSVTIDNPSAGDLSLTGAVVSSNAGSNCASGSIDSRCAAPVAVTNSVSLTFNNTAGVISTVAGATVVYTVLVSNSSASDLPSVDFAVPLTGVLDDAVYNNDAVAGSGVVSYTQPQLTWSGPVAAGATITVTYSVTVNTAITGDQILTDQLSSTSLPGSNNCTTGSSDPRCLTTVGIARLVLAQSYTEASTTPGSVIHLSATFTNTGAVPYEGITVVSPSAATVDDAIPVGDQSATSGTLVLSATAITWTGDIPVGGVVTVTGTLTVKNPDPADRLITGTLVSTAPGNNCPADGVDPRCTASLAVLLPGLTITTTADRTTVEPGGVVGYTVLITNSGETPYAAASVTDDLTGALDDSVYNDDATRTSGTLTYSAPALTWTGDLAVGATVVITFTVNARNPRNGDNTLLNLVTSSEIGSSCLPASGNPGCTDSVDVLAPGLTIVTTADAATVNLGTTVTFTVAVTNTGQTTYAAASFSDPLAGVTDDATYNPASTSATIGATNYVAGVLSWSGALSPGQSAVISYTVTINNPDTGDHTMINTVTSSTDGNNCGGSSTDTRCRASVTVLDTVAVTFTKTSDVASTVDAGVVNYTITVVNASVSAVSTVFADDLTGVLDDAVYNDDVSASSGTTGFDSPNITWSGSVPAAGVVTISYSVTVRVPAAGNLILTSVLTSTAPTTSNNCLASSADARCRSSVAVARLDVLMSADRTTATPGSVIALTETFTNLGQVPYFGISVTYPRVDAIDDAYANGDEAVSSGSVVFDPTNITWTGNIPVGETVTITRTITVRDPDPGNQRVSATLISTVPGNNCAAGSSDPRCTYLTTVLTPALTLTTIADVPVTVPGGTVTYTVTIENSGQSPYLGAVVADSLAGLLDDAVYNADADATRGAVSYGASNLTWTGDLAVGQTATITYSVTVNSPNTGDKVMASRLVSTDQGSSCRPGSTTDGCTNVVIVLTPALTIVTGVDVGTAFAGDTVTYTVTVTNSGQTDYPIANVQAPLTGLLDDAGYGGDVTADTGEVVRNGDFLDWSGSLSVGATATITYSFAVGSPPTGDHRLTQTVSSSVEGNNCASGGSDPRCSTLVLIGGLQLVHTADVSTSKPTDVIHYTATFTNTGQVPYVGITVLADVSDAADDFTYNGDAAATTGSVRIVIGEPTISWTGDIPVGATVVFTSSATVNNPDPGDQLIVTTISTTAPGSNCPLDGDDPLCTDIVTVLNPGLTIVQAASTTTSTPGGTVGYTITVTNTGETAYTDAVVKDLLVSTLTDATYNSDATTSSGTVGYSSEVLTWTGDLGIGDFVVISYTVTVNNPDLGDKVMVNRVVSDELGSTCPTGADDAACVTTVTVLIPALDIAIVADSTSTTPGSVVGYTVTVSNTGQTDYVAATVTIGLAGVLDDAAAPSDGTTDIGTVSFAGTDLSWTGDIAMGTTVTISYTVTVDDPDTGDQLLTTSVASGAAGGTCPSDAPCVNEIAVLTPGLAVSIAADSISATPGQQVTFTITVSNTGQTSYTAATVTTDLAMVTDDATFDGTVSASVGVAAYSAPTLTWTGSLAPGADAVIAYTVTISNPDPGDKLVSSTVVADVVGSSCPTNSTNTGCSASVTVLVPALTITQTADAATAIPGTTIGYTVTITNSGETPYTAITVTDSLADALSDVVYDNNAVVVGGGAVVYNAPRLTWSGDLDIGAVVTITYSLTVRNPDPGDKNVINSVTSTAPGSSCPTGTLAPGCSSNVRVLVPELTITQTADHTTVVAGSPVQYTITVVNTGEYDYPVATFSDPLTGILDDATYPGDATASVGTVSYSTGTLTWTGALPIGATATIAFSVTTDYPATGDTTMPNRIISSTQGSNCLTGVAALCNTSVSVLVPALLIAKSVDTATIVAGGTVRYTISAKNTGEADYPSVTLSDSLAELLDEAAYNNDAAANSGVVTYADQSLRWTGALAVGATVTITYSVSSDIVFGTGDGTLDNRVVSTEVGSNCAEDSLDARCVTSTVVESRTIGLTGLTAAFTLTGVPGATVTAAGVVTMTVTTNSPAGYTVTVQSTTAGLDSTTPGNTDATIPITALWVRESGTNPFLPLSVEPLVVHQQQRASAPDGDAVSNDYQVQIPFVTPDSYATTLEYIVTAQ